MRSTLGGLGPVWGQDEQGATFHAHDEPKAAMVAAAADNVGRGLATIRQGVDAMSVNHAGTDAGIRSGLSVR